MEANTANIYNNGQDGGDVCLPGYGMPLGFCPSDHFPILVGEHEVDWAASTLTIREVCMLRFIEDITNKPEWWRKVNDPAIAANWSKEALEMPWAEYVKFGDFTQEMVDACMKELRKKAEIYEKTDLIPVMDYSTAAIKSDRLISKELRESLKAAVARFENVPDEAKDWHPGSNGQVLDLVHPSMWPLVHGRSFIIPKGRITLENCLEHCGMGEVIPVPKKEFQIGYNTCLPQEIISDEFQWLPCDVNIAGGRARIESYINNVHPVRNAELYPVVEKILEKCLPAWDIVYRWHDEFEVQRVTSDVARTECIAEDICNSDENEGCGPLNRPLDEGETAREEYEQYSEGYKGSERQRRDIEWYDENHLVEKPDPKVELEDLIKLDVSHFYTTEFFDGTERIQVIVKLANIHLTPEKPSYDGGTWHVEGQLNEHICATALYYYDNDNITECHLDLRTAANAEELNGNLSYEQGDNESIDRTFAIRSGGSTLQNVGSILTQTDRMIFFPNVFQHHVSPFELKDPSRPGYRKILALFLVDPAATVISTANVPPQQLDWWADQALPADKNPKLPPEVTEMVVDCMDFPISEKEAKELREKLITERSRGEKKANSHLRQVEWHFCEH